MEYFNYMEKISYIYIKTAMIKASFEVLNPTSGQSFHTRRFGESAFEAPYHFHSELELTAIIKGKGKRYIGNHMENFQEGDLVLLGSNLPHCWKLEPAIAKQEAGAIVVQFDKEFLGKDFFDKAELSSIKNLLDNSRYGVRFAGDTINKIQEQLISLAQEKNNFKALISLISTLYLLATSENYSLLDKQRSTGTQAALEQERINPVLAYIVENFNSKISLEVAAEIAHMSTNAFCKYFKKTTRKTFIETVIEYRLNYARQQLTQTDNPISDISYESGFGDVSHFYKIFKSNTKLSPLNYRKKFRQGIV